MTPEHKLLINLAEKVSLPVVYLQVKDLVVDPDAEIDDFVLVIDHDPTLAERIIKMANSQFFGYSRKVTTVKQAISLIGVIQVHDLLLSSLAIRAFSGIPDDVINQEVFWRSCIYCGIVARLLAKRCMMPASEGLFTAGLLHEIGHLVMYAQIPEKIQALVLEYQQTNKALYLLERDTLGFDYGKVGSQLMQMWHLPKNYCDIAQYHLQPEKAQENKIEMQLINLARAVMLTEEGGPESVIDEILEKQNTLIHQKLTRQDVENIRINARSYIDEVMDCLWPFSKKITEDYQIIL